MSGVIIIGAGQAGASCAAKLRNLGYEGAVTLIGAETVPPYQRPPLSKAYLLGEMDLERLYLRPERYYAEQDIDLRLNTWVTGIDVAAKTVAMADDTRGYDALVLTTGSIPRRLPASIGGDLDSVYVMRDLGDADAMAPEMQPGRRVLIVGGGYIGLEAAAVAAKKGLEVVVVELADRILQRVAAPETSDFFRALHTRHGVTILEKTGLVRLLGETRVSGAELSDGREIEVDFVVAGVGIEPATALAEMAGIATENGIAVDAQGRTSANGVWAAGDCASFPYAGNRIRLESVPHAIDQAECVAANIVGADQDYIARPWFLSDQYDVKLQIEGLNTGYDTVFTRNGGAAQAFWYYRGDTLLAVDAANDPRAYMIGKRLIEAGKSADPAVVADPQGDLKALLR